jgi:hypothetical protein
LKQLVLGIVYYGLGALFDRAQQVLHNPVTLKLQEEEEEQLLAQSATPSCHSDRL